MLNNWVSFGVGVLMGIFFYYLFSLWLLVQPLPTEGLFLEDEDQK